MENIFFSLASGILGRDPILAKEAGEASTDRTDASIRVRKDGNAGEGAKGGGIVKFSGSQAPAGKSSKLRPLRKSHEK